MKAALTVLSLLLLTGCSGAKVVAKTETVYAIPPAVLLTPCSHPVWNGGTYRDLVDYSLLLKAALEECDAKIESLRVWVEMVQEKGRSGEP